MRTPRLFVVSGPSGVGKGTVVSLLRERTPHLGLTVSATTRKPRPGEIDGQTYYFMTEEEFSKRVANGEFLEWANVFGNCYGTLMSEVERVLTSGSSVILEIDTQGALQVKEKMPEAVLVFIAPPSLQVLEERLRGRATETEEAIERRLGEAEGEIERSSRYDKVLVNDELEDCVSELQALIATYEGEVVA